MSSVVIAIPTFRRPQWLERLLSAIEQLDTHAQVTVLVADNDAERLEGYDLCRKIRKRGYRWPLECIIVSERGIAQARNALAARILATPSIQYVAMLDDDEWPAPDWLENFLWVQRETGADALHGAVLRVFEREPGAWAAHCEGISPLRHKTGPIPMVEGTGNVFMLRRCLEDLPQPCFDPLFALTGGEDRDFFTRLRAQGKRFAWADEAIAYAFVPSSRANLKWALQRAYRVGNSDMRVLLKYRPKASVLVREYAKIAGALLLFPLLSIILGLIPNRRVMPLGKACRATGKIAALLGQHYNEYATVHGQ